MSSSQRNNTALKIGFNARTLTDSSLRGFNRYITGLIPPLRSILQKEGSIHLFTDQPIAQNHLKTLDGCILHASEFRPHLIWEQVLMPIQAVQSNVQIIHSPINLGISMFHWGNIPRVVTLHDMLTHEEVEIANSSTLKFIKTNYLSFWVSWQSLHQAEAIITVSEYSKKQILKTYPHWNDKVFVISNGVDSHFSPGPIDETVLKKHNLTQPYLLYVGGFECRKNLKCISEASRILMGRGRNNYTIALVGRTESRIKDNHFHDHTSVRWLGTVPESELVVLYRGASCFIFPSKAEGFGLPVLEAMACGTPVLSSNASSLPEVGGDAVQYFGPDSPRELAHWVELAMSDTSWCQDHREKGLKQAKKFSWENSARQTLAVYERLL